MAGLNRMRFDQRMSVYNEQSLDSIACMSVYMYVLDDVCMRTYVFCVCMCMYVYV